MDQVTQQPQAIAKVFVQRDYSEGTAVKFQSKVPTDIEDRIDQATFERFMQDLNDYYAEAEQLSCKTYCQGCFVCLTAYTALFCMDTQYQVGIKRASQFIKEQNVEVFAPRGLKVMDPFQRGLRVIEISVYPSGQQQQRVNNHDGEKWSRF